MCNSNNWCRVQPIVISSTFDSLSSSSRLFLFVDLFFVVGFGRRLRQFVDRSFVVFFYFFVETLSSFFVILFADMDSWTSGATRIFVHTTSSTASSFDKIRSLQSTPLVTRQSRSGSASLTTLLLPPRNSLPTAPPSPQVDRFPTLSAFVRIGFRKPIPLVTRQAQSEPASLVALLPSPSAPQLSPDGAFEPLVDLSPTPFGNLTLSPVVDEIRNELDRVGVQPATQFLTQTAARFAQIGDRLSLQIAAQVAAFAEELKSFEDPRCERDPRAITRAHDDLSSAPVTDSATAGLAQLATLSSSCSVAPNVSTRRHIPYTGQGTPIFSSCPQSTTFLPIPISSTEIAFGAQMPSVLMPLSPAPTPSEPMVSAEGGTHAVHPPAHLDLRGDPHLSINNASWRPSLSFLTSRLMPRPSFVTCRSVPRLSFVEASTYVGDPALEAPTLVRDPLLDAPTLNCDPSLDAPTHS